MYLPVNVVKLALSLDDTGQFDVSASAHPTEHFFLGFGKFAVAYFFFEGLSIAQDGHFQL